MQEYMIEKNKDFAPEFTENVSDEAVVSFRKIIRNKKTKKAEKTEEKPQEEMERTSVFSYAATACLVLAVLAVGAGFYRNYSGLPVQPEDDYAVTVMSGKTEEDASEEKQAENDPQDSPHNPSLQQHLVNGSISAVSTGKLKVRREIFPKNSTCPAMAE